VAFNTQQNTINVTQGDTIESSRLPNAGDSNIAEFGLQPANDDFRSILISKADKFEVDNLQTLKANKCDTDLCFKWLDILQK